MVLESLLSRLLTRLLSRYVEGLTIETLRFSVWAGDVLLTDLRLRPDALDALQLPLSAVGRIGRLRIRVPWSRLRTEPVRPAVTRAPARPARARLAVSTPAPARALHRLRFSSKTSTCWQGCASTLTRRRTRGASSCESGCDWTRTSWRAA
jgi:hypothetical protein